MSDKPDDRRKVSIDIITIAWGALLFAIAIGTYNTGENVDKTTHQLALMEQEFGHMASKLDTLGDIYTKVHKLEFQMETVERDIISFSVELADLKGSD